ncbi:MAG: NAD(P)H-dependent glycerol-3-phosphate dehydrogenase [Chitinophagaceae bacterium]|nr:MAG: NAD(P)H-dependent glycerol-3-phosphate dehydrogenase [Chitinophagaceae bacterium]
MVKKISVIGGGSWATAITKILSANRHDIKWWLRQEETVAHIRKFKHNPKYLSSVEFDLPEENITSDLKFAFADSEYIVLGVPSKYLPQTLAGLQPKDFEGKKIISAIKGIIQDGNLLVSQYMQRHFSVPADMIANISGPCHAEEVAAEKLSYLTLSSPNQQLAEESAALFNVRFVHTRWCTDLAGTEYASILKNVYAIATGLSIGLGYGDNFRAVLVSNAMEEMHYFLQNILPEKRNDFAPAYLGDTLVTCYSQYSRNRTFGLMLGNGYTINSAILELGQVAEGYYSTKALKTISQEHNLKMPILESVYHILYEKIAPSIEFRVLSSQLG